MGTLNKTVFRLLQKQASRSSASQLAKAGNAVVRGQGSNQRKRELAREQKARALRGHAATGASWSTVLGAVTTSQPSGGLTCSPACFSH